mmetsp:Transcript_8448/g.25571  ORF Transcript_8448/g.25571 Transcript_8448/m.25571 type:complete len:255 (+) Transcript_8448:3424-4188(+)
MHSKATSRGWPSECVASMTLSAPMAEGLKLFFRAPFLATPSLSISARMICCLRLLMPAGSCRNLRMDCWFMLRVLTPKMGPVMCILQQAGLTMMPALLISTTPFSAAALYTFRKTSSRALSPVPMRFTSIVKMPGLVSRWSIWRSIRRTFTVVPSAATRVLSPMSGFASLLSSTGGCTPTRYAIPGFTREISIISLSSCVQLTIVPPSLSRAALKTSMNELMWRPWYNFCRVPNAPALLSQAACRRSRSAGLSC